MMKQHPIHEGHGICRRRFICACGCAAAGLAMRQSRFIETAGAAEAIAAPRDKAFVRGAFLFAPTESLRQQGYYSWPGSGFDAENRQKEYAARIAEIEQKLGMTIVMEPKPLCDAAGVAQFIQQAKATKPDGLLLIPFQKAQWENMVRIIRQTEIPSVVLSTAGVVLSTHLNELHRMPGVYLVSSLDNFQAVEYGMRMIRTGWKMRTACVLSIGGKTACERVYGPFQTRIRVMPQARFAEEFKNTAIGDEVKDIAATYRKNAQKVVEPSETDIVNAARTSIACRRVIAAEKASAMTMDCLGGIRANDFPPPCMGFMDLRDSGIIAGCQNELEPTLTMMLVQFLFDKPGFQQNPFMDTERNLFQGSHCTSPTRLGGARSSPEPYVLRSHAEAGVGTVPEVIWPVGQDATIACYVPAPKHQLLIYSGKVVGRHQMPPAGGCRTNLWMTINEVSDVCDVKGLHQTIFAGNHARQLRAFCQLFKIAATT